MAINFKNFQINQKKNLLLSSSLEKAMELLGNREKMEGDDGRIPCPTCDRRFCEQALRRHEKICKSLTSKPMPKRGGAKKHLSAFELEAQRFKAAAAKKASETPAVVEIKGAKMVKNGFYECLGCSRTFNQKAAERHTEFCIEKQKKLPNKDLIEANRVRLELLRRRTSYNPKVTANQSCPVLKRVIFPLPINQVKNGIHSHKKI